MVLTLLILCGAAVFYIIAGYPLLVYLLRRIHSRPVNKAPTLKSVTAIVAVHNGGHYLRAKLDSFLAQNYPPELLEIIVVSDGSTDDTDRIASEYASRGVRLIQQRPKQGKCAALNQAIPEAKGEILVLTDVRQVLDPEAIRYLMESYADETVGAVSAEVLIRSSDGLAEADIQAYWKFECWLRDSLAQIDSMIGATGMFYSMRKSLAVPIPPHVLLDDLYLPLRGAFFRGYRLVMERRARAWDVPMPLDTEFRRKVRTLAGQYQLLREMPELLGPGNRMWLHYVSCKLSRLLLPWLLVAFFVLGMFLPSPWNLILTGLQIAAYGLALLDPVLPQRFILRRISSPARSFLVMMWAAVLGMKVFFVAPQKLWKVTNAQSTTTAR